MRNNRRNPLAGIATNPSRHLVTFLSEELPAALLGDPRSLRTAATSRTWQTVTTLLAMADGDASR